MGEKPKIEIYGSEHCGFCTAARILLKKKGMIYEDILVSGNPQALSDMQQRSGSTSVPQVFINDQPVGGFDDLYELDQNGDLDKLLGTHDDVTGNQE